MYPKEYQYLNDRTTGATMNNEELTKEAGRKLRGSLHSKMPVRTSNILQLVTVKHCWVSTGSLYCP